MTNDDKRISTADVGSEYSTDCALTSAMELLLSLWKSRGMTSGWSGWTIIIIIIIIASIGCSVWSLWIDTAVGHIDCIEKQLHKILRRPRMRPLPVLVDQERWYLPFGRPLLDTNLDFGVVAAESLDYDIRSPHASKEGITVHSFGHSIIGQRRGTFVAVLHRMARRKTLCYGSGVR